MHREFAASHLPLPLSLTSSNASVSMMPPSLANGHGFVAVSAHSRLRNFYCDCAHTAVRIVGRPVAFHLTNVMLGFVGAVAMAVGVTLATALVPVGSIDVAHSLIMTIIARLCRVDIAVHNVLAGRAVDQIAFPSQSELPICDGAVFSFHSKRLVASPPPPLLGIFYFGVVRVALALLTSVCLALLALFTIAFSHDHLHVQITNRSGDKMAVGLWIYVECLAGAIVCSVALHAIGRVSQATTRAVCCDREQRPEE